MKCEKYEEGYKVEGHNFKLDLSFQNDALELWGDIFPSGHGEIINELELFRLLNGLGLKGQVDHHNVRELCKQACAGKEVKNIVLVRANTSVFGTDGRLELVSEEARSGEIINVHAGDVIARYIPPTAGTGGENLQGQAIPAEPGQEIKVILGDNAGWGNQAAGEIIAQADGRLVYDAQTATISVLDTLIIEGNLDHKYGDIDFIGTVEIRGDVEQGFHVRAGKNLKIKGNVESAFLEAEGDVEIGGGFSGKHRGMIKSGGNMSLRYADICHIECKGNLAVKNEIVDGKVFVEGYIDVSNGSIIGGTLMALGGIEAKVIGSEAGMRTFLSTGQSYLAEREIAALKEEEKNIEKQLAEISRFLDPYVKDAHLLSRMSDSDRQELRRKTAEFTRLNIQVKKIPDQITEIRARGVQKSNPVINVGKAIAKGVELNIDGFSGVIPETMRQNVSIVRNSAVEGFRFINHIRLSDNARKAERDVAKMEMKRELQRN